MGLSKPQILARCPLFAQLGDEDLVVLAGAARFRHYPSGSTLFLAAEAPEGLHVLVSGEIKIYVLSPQTGRELVLTTEHPFNAVAELPSFDGGSYPASAQAIHDSETLFIAQTELMRILLERPTIAVHLLKTLGRRLRRLVGLIEQLSFQAVSHRLAGYLLERSSEGLPFLLETNPVIAAKLGTVPELVSRNLSRLHQSGVLQLTGRSVTRLDPGALKEMAESAER